MTNEALEVVWRPQPGPQSLLLSCPSEVDEIFFGGARGGGKSDGAIGAWLDHANRYGANARGMFLRRSLPELEEIQNRMMAIFPRLGASHKVSTRVWTFPGGATLKMSFLDVDDDASKYQGHQWTWLAFDEAGAWPTSRAIDMLRACLRSPHGVPCRLLLTGNPGGKGHQWLQERFVDPAPPGTPFRGEDGTLRVFIPSKLQDNKILMNADPGYEDRLKASGPSWQVRAWLLGDWDARQEGALLKREWMQPYTLVPDKFERVVMSLDTAFKQGQANDYSVATVWGVTKTGFYLLDLVRAKLEFPALKATVLQLAEKWPPHVVLVEDKASGQSLIQALKQETRLPVLAVKVDADKVSRCNAITPTLEAGRVYVPHKAPWLEAFLDECLMFPFGSHDDQIDSMTQALNYMAAPMANAGIFDYYKRKAEAARGGAA